MAVIRGDTVDYRDGHAGPGDVGLIVEISESTLERDRVLKKRIYAEAAIPVYWVIDLNARRVEVFGQPRNAQYSECTVYLPGDSIPVVPDAQAVGSVLVTDLLPDQVERSYSE